MACPIESFEATGDLQVTFDDGSTIKVHSAVLGLASPVFAAMLCCQMQEARTKSLKLPGKRREEFDLFVSLLRPASSAQVSAENVDILIPWVCEYQVSKLWEDCEKVLVTLKVTAERLVQAHVHGFTKQCARCKAEMTYDEFADNFEHLAHHKDVLMDLLPSLTKQQPALQQISDLIAMADSSGLVKLVPSFRALLKNIKLVDEHIVLVLSTLLGKVDPTSVSKIVEDYMSKRVDLCEKIDSVAEEVYRAIPQKCINGKSDIDVKSLVKDIARFV